MNKKHKEPKMANYVERKVLAIDAKIGTNLANCDAIDIENYVSGKVYIPTGSLTTTLTFYAAPVSNGTYNQMYDATPAAISMTVAAGHVYTLPSTVMGVKWLKIKGNADGEDLVLLVQT